MNPIPKRKAEDAVSTDQNNKKLHCHERTQVSVLPPGYTRQHPFPIVDSQVAPVNYDLYQVIKNSMLAMNPTGVSDARNIFNAFFMDLLNHSLFPSNLIHHLDVPWVLDTSKSESPFYDLLNSSQSGSIYPPLHSSFVVLLGSTSANLELVLQALIGLHQMRQATQMVGSVWGIYTTGTLWKFYWVKASGGIVESDTFMMNPMEPAQVLTIYRYLYFILQNMIFSPER
jgi:hypothetical protein